MDQPEVRSSEAEAAVDVMWKGKVFSAAFDAYQKYSQHTNGTGDEHAINQKNLKKSFLYANHVPKLWSSARVDGLLKILLENDLRLDRALVLLRPVL